MQISQTNIVEYLAPNCNIPIMNKSDQYTNLYSGSEVLVLGLKHRLEEEDIPTLIKNDFNSDNIGGFLGGTPSTIRIMVKESDLEKAKRILVKFEGD